MTDKELKQNLKAYIDNELDEPIKSELESRLKTNSELANELKILSSLSSKVQDLPEPKPSMSLRASIMEKARAEGFVKESEPNTAPGLTKWFRTMRWAVAAGAAVVALVVLYPHINNPKPMTMETAAPKYSEAPATTGAPSPAMPNQPETNNTANPPAPNNTASPLKTDTQSPEDKPAVTAPPSPPAGSANGENEAEKPDTNASRLAKSEHNYTPEVASGAGETNDEGNSLSAMADAQSERYYYFLGEVELLTPDIAGAKTKLQSIADIRKGQLTPLKDEKRRVNYYLFMLTMPVNNFSWAFDDVLKVGSVLNQNTLTEDITEKLNNAREAVADLTEFLIVNSDKLSDKEKTESQAELDRAIKSRDELEVKSQTSAIKVTVTDKSEKK